jgi:hypothetical protein
VRHASRGLGLLAKAGFKVWVVGKICLEQFDCNGSAQTGVDTLIDVGHATATDEVSDLIATCDNPLVFRQCIAPLEMFI